MPVEQQRLQQALRWLQFDPAAEARFAEAYERQSLLSRPALLIVTILLVGITPLYDERLLAAPPAFLRIERLLDFGVEIPLLLLALVVTLVRRWRGASASLVIVAVLVLSLLIGVQRVLGAQHGFYVPHDLAALPLAGALVLGRLRLRRLMPWLLLGMAGLTALNVIVLATPDAWYDGITEWMLFMIMTIAGYLIERSTRESWYRGEQLEWRASHDPLTGLGNRRQFDDALLQGLGAACSGRRPVALMIFDIDAFKAYNDHYGHVAGDDCLRRIGHALPGADRPAPTICARIGGEEFAAVWFDIAEAAAIRRAEQLRQQVERLALPAAPEAPQPIVSASAGLCWLPALSAHDEPAALADHLLRCADRALYTAKHEGRARLVTHGSRRHDQAAPVP